MEAGGDADGEILADMGLVEYVQAVIEAYGGGIRILPAVINAVERVTEVKPGSVFVTGCVSAVVIWHHVGSEEEAAMYADIPVSYRKVEFAPLGKT